MNDDAYAEAAVRRALDALQLNQAQLAALLAVSPQAVSKGLRDEGVNYLRSKAKPLHQTLIQIGGERYAAVASALKELAGEFGWGSLESQAEGAVPPQDLYLGAEELWVVSDSPAAVLSWEALRGLVMSPLGTTTERLVVFFVRTLEGAERWAEVLEREFARDAVVNGTLEPERSAVSNAYMYIVVSNALTYAQDHIIASPGSRCMGVDASARGPNVYSWIGSGYSRVTSPNLEFVRLAQDLGLGLASHKVNFFPLGQMLKSDIVEFRHVFMDGIIAVRGRSEFMEHADADEGLAGGVLSSVVGRAPRTLAFNQKTKFNPVFLLTYKRRPGDGMNKSPSRTVRVLQEELLRGVHNQEGEGITRQQPTPRYF